MAIQDMLVSRVHLRQRLTDASAAGPVPRDSPDAHERLAEGRSAHLPRYARCRSAEHEGLHSLRVLRNGEYELQQQLHMPLHRAAHVEQHKQSRSSGHPPLPWEYDRVSPAAEVEAHRPAKVRAAFAPVSLAPSAGTGRHGTNHPRRDSGQLRKLVSAQHAQIGWRGGRPSACPCSEHLHERLL